MALVKYFLCVCLLCLAPLQAKTGSFAIAGVVLDPSGSPVPGARVRVKSASGGERSGTTDQLGAFRFDCPAAGVYEVTAGREGFQPASARVTVVDRSPATVELRLELASVHQEVTVAGNAEQVTTDAGENRDVVTLDRTMLDDLPVLDQDYVAAMAQFLDPGSVGTGGVTLVVDGMEQKNVGVSASAIQEVKINQNPYAAEFARPGRGRIEVITKPASAVLHGTLNVVFRDAVLDARDPFAAQRPDERKETFEGSLTGPLGSGKRTSFMLTANHQADDLQAAVFALGPTGLIQKNAPDPQRNIEYSSGVSRQFSEGHLASWRADYRLTSEQNRNVGGLVLPSSGIDFRDREDEIVYNDTLNLGSSVLNQFRLLAGRQYTYTDSVSSAPGIVVLGAFTGGGAQADQLLTETHVQLNDFVSWTAGKHQVKAGINVPDISRRGLVDSSNLGGTYTFSTLADYLRGQPLSLLEQQGNGKVIYLEVVLGGFIQDEVRLRPNLTVSVGARYDWQNFTHDNNNVSPRISFAYAPGKRTVVFRGGAGLFYDRTGPQPIFDLERYNGAQMRQVLMSDPPYPGPIDPAVLAAQPTDITRFDPNLKLPYTFQYSLGAERQISKSATLAVTYWGNRGIDLFRSRDVNAPLPPLYLSRPDPTLGVYREIESAGRLQSDAMEVTFRGKPTRYFGGMVQYTLGRAYSNVGGNYSASTRTFGINMFPANNYDLSGEWARADYDQRHRLNLMGAFHPAKFLNLGVGLFVGSGLPYSETTGRDDNHDGFANDRPAGVPRNSLQGPGYAQFDLRWSHDVALRNADPKGPKLTIAADAFNVANHTNYTSYNGDLSSPLFGKAVAAKPPRRLQLSLRFNF